jgi:hypothetical protein
LGYPLTVRPKLKKKEKKKKESWIVIKKGSLNVYYNSRVAQWKRVGPITQRCLFFLCLIISKFVSSFSKIFHSYKYTEQNRKFWVLTKESQNVKWGTYIRANDYLTDKTNFNSILTRFAGETRWMRFSRACTDQYIRVYFMKPFRIIL